MQSPVLPSVDFPIKEEDRLHLTCSERFQESREGRSQRSLDMIWFAHSNSILGGNYEYIVVPLRQVNAFQRTRSQITHQLRKMRERNQLPASWRCDLRLWNLRILTSENERHR